MTQLGELRGQVLVVKILDRGIDLKSRGLGCLETLAQACGGGMTADRLRDMLAGELVAIEDWRAVGRGLDKLEGKEDGNE